jgi:hypothetical protein
MVARGATEAEALTLQWALYVASRLTLGDGRTRLVADRCRAIVNANACGYRYWRRSERTYLLTHVVTAEPVPAALVAVTVHVTVNPIAGLPTSTVALV